MKQSPASPVERRCACCIRASPPCADCRQRASPHLNLNVVVQFVGRVAVAVEANITAFRAFGVDQFALVGFDVVLVLPSTGSDFVLKSLLKMVFTPDLKWGHRTPAPRRRDTRVPANG